MAEERGYRIAVDRAPLGNTRMDWCIVRFGGRGWIEAPSTSPYDTLNWYDSTATVESTLTVTNLYFRAGQPRCVGTAGDVLILAYAFGSGSVASVSFSSGDTLILRLTDAGAVSTVWKTTVGYDIFDVNASSKVIACEYSPGSTAHRVATVDLSTGAGSTIATTTFTTAAATDYVSCAITDSDVTALMNQRAIDGSGANATATDVHVDTAGGVSFGSAVTIGTGTGFGSCIFQRGNSLVAYSRLEHVGNDLMCAMNFQTSSGSAAAHTPYVYRLTSPFTSSSSVSNYLDSGTVGAGSSAYPDPIWITPISASQFAYAYAFNAGHTISADYSATLSGSRDGGFAVVIVEFPSGAITAAHVTYIDVQGSVSDAPLLAIATAAPSSDDINALLTVGDAWSGGAPEVGVVMFNTDQTSGDISNVTHMIVDYSPVDPTYDMDFTGTTAGTVIGVVLFAAAPITGWAAGWVVGGIAIR